jgi:hypothetical protein
MDNEAKRRALIRISNFVLNENAEKARGQLEEIIIETSLLHGVQTDEYVSIETLHNLIEQQIIFSTIANDAIEKILERLIKKGSVMQNQDNLYALTMLRRAELNRLVNERQQLIQKINTEFLVFLEQEYGKKLSEEQRIEGLSRLYDLLESLALEKSDLVARLLTRKNLDNLPNEISIHKMLSILEKIEDTHFRNAEMSAIKKMFKESKDGFYDFLFSLTQNLICIQILNLDPQCQILERQAFSDKVLFLDTNILIALICPTRFLHKAAKNMVTLSKSLGVECVVAKKTCDEYLGTLKEANELFKKFSSPLKFLENSDNDFLSSFWAEKQKNNALSWLEYFENTKNIGKVLTDLGIKVDEEDQQKIYKSTHFKEVVDSVGLYYQLLKGRTKSNEACEHDALLLLLVKYLRAKEPQANMLGAKYWFITGDETLARVDEQINGFGEFKDRMPSAILCDVWIEMITPFVPLSNRKIEAQEAFSLLLKQQFNLVPVHLDIEKLTKIQGDWTKYDWLQPEDIIRIQNQEWTKRYIKQVEKAKADKNVNKVEEMGHLFAAKLNSELTQIMDDKVRKLSEEKIVLTEKEDKLSANLELKMKEIEQARAELEEKKKELLKKEQAIKESDSIIQTKDRQLVLEATFKRQLRLITTVAGLVLIASPLIMLAFGILPIKFEGVGFAAVFCIIAAILLYSGIAPERVKVALGAKLNVTFRKGKEEETSSPE